MAKKLLPNQISAGCICKADLIAHMSASNNIPLGKHMNCKYIKGSFKLIETRGCEAIKFQCGS